MVFIMEVTVQCPICKEMLKLHIPSAPIQDKAKEHTLATVVIVHGSHSFILYVDANWRIRGMISADATIIVPKE